ncbi:MAG: hypothetical protein M3Q36_02370 [bacterium]|nr:hypothetical protein [bacterium]
MYIVKILKRLDAASVVVAIVLGMIVLQLLQSVTSYLAVDLVGTRSEFGSSPSVNDMYLLPVVAAVLQVALLELGLRLVVLVRGKLVRRG